MCSLNQQTERNTGMKIIEVTDKGVEFEASWDDIKDIEALEFIPVEECLKVGDVVAFEHDGKALTGIVDWLLGDGDVAVRVEGFERSFAGSVSKFSKIV